MTYTTALICTLSIVIAAVIGVVRFKKINPAYYPFLILVWVAFLNEVIGFLLSRTIRSNTVNNNIYVLIESLLILWQFQKWHVFDRSMPLFRILLVVFPLAWVVNIFIISGINSTAIYFRIFYSFVIVLISINTINGLIILERRNILKNPVFLINIGFILYFTLKLLVQTILIYGSGVSSEFRMNVIITHVYVNLFANLIYGLAVLWMPSKQRFSMPSSS
jgi:hypothetical protein